MTGDTAKSQRITPRFLDVPPHMRRAFLCFILLLLAASCLPACRESYSLRDSELIRKLRLRNTPQTVFADFADAMKAGNLEQMLTLSTPRIREILENEIRFEDPSANEEDFSKKYAEALRKRFEKKNPQIAEGASDDNRALFILNVPDDRYPLRLEFHLVRDRHGNWKNDSRLQQIRSL